MANRFQVFTEDPALRATVEEGLSRWNPASRMLGGALRATAEGHPPDVLIVDLSHPLADVLVDSVRHMPHPPAVVGIAGEGAPASFPFAWVDQPVEDLVLAFSVRSALSARRDQADARRPDAITRLGSRAVPDAA